MKSVVSSLITNYEKRNACAAGSAYLNTADGAVQINIPRGLGTRHQAVARITKATKAVGVVVSEGDRQVRVFRNGRLLGGIDPLMEIWLEV